MADVIISLYPEPMCRPYPNKAKRITLKMGCLMYLYAPPRINLLPETGVGKCDKFLLSCSKLTRANKNPKNRDMGPMILSISVIEIRRAIVGIIYVTNNIN